jgi:serine protease Do
MPGIVVVVASLLLGAPGQGARAPAAPCQGAYLDVLPPHVRALPAQAFTFALRTSATYECPYYGADGSLRRSRRRVTAHGTGFAFRRQGAATLLLTNSHVAEWPVATDAEHGADGVPSGCRRTDQRLRIVDSEVDEDESDDIPLELVAADPRLDLAIVRAAAALPLMPWQIGRSRELRERNAVVVQGFPLGRLRAENVGKVVAAHDHDTYRAWDHDDFVVDALLSPGHSGSPVFATSCQTGQPELVGVYHAAYSRGTALNVVVSIDQARDLMERLEGPPAAAEPVVDQASRARLLELAGRVALPAFPFGRHTALVRARRDGALVFELMAESFPLRAVPLLVLEDGRCEPAAGAPMQVWAGGRHGLRPVEPDRLDPEARHLLGRVLAALRLDAGPALELRVLEASAGASRGKSGEVARLERAVRRTADQRQDLALAASELAERLAPGSGDASVDLSAPLQVGSREEACAPQARDGAGEKR